MGDPILIEGDGPIGCAGAIARPILKELEEDIARRRSDGTRHNRLVVQDRTESGLVGRGEWCIASILEVKNRLYGRVFLGRGSWKNPTGVAGARAVQARAFADVIDVQDDLVIDLG